MRYVRLMLVTPFGSLVRCSLPRSAPNRVHASRQKASASGPCGSEALCTEGGDLRCAANYTRSAQVLAHVPGPELDHVAVGIVHVGGAAAAVGELDLLHLLAALAQAGHRGVVVLL